MMNNLIFLTSWAGETLRQPRPLIFRFCFLTDVMQILISVVQIHANYVLNICSVKSKIFLMGWAGAMHVEYCRCSPYRATATRDDCKIGQIY